MLLGVWRGVFAGRLCKRRTAIRMPLASKKGTAAPLAA